ncbi:MAG: DUF1273 domain-containing protein, partial [Oscillospiraceae bacterium]|nr:DUF1273 domain-containing protein [Oscillospiraceae bacterium]
SCCFTGHRHISSEETKDPQAILTKTLIDLIHQGVHTFYAGGALGFDTMAELIVLKLRKKYKHIRLVLLLSCRDQSKGWPQSDQNLYDHILKKANEIVYISEHYYSGCMQARNRALVDHSDICVCYLTKPAGGTAYTVRYAKQKGLPVINLAEQNE